MLFALERTLLLMGTFPNPKRSFGMGNSDICELSKTMTADKLTYNDQHMAPVGWCHSGCPVFVFFTSRSK